MIRRWNSCPTSPYGFRWNGAPDAPASIFHASLRKKIFHARKCGRNGGMEKGRSCRLRRARCGLHCKNRFSDKEMRELAFERRDYRLAANRFFHAQVLRIG